MCRLTLTYVGGEGGGGGGGAAICPPDGGERPAEGGAAGGQERQLSAWIIAVSKLHFWPLYFLLAEPVFSIGGTCVYLQIGSTLKSPTAWQTFPATKSLNECILNQARRSVDNSEIFQILLFSFPASKSSKPLPSY